MTNIKTKIRTILIAAFISTICSSFFVANFAYAGPGAPTPITPNNNNLTEGTFDVTKNLTLDQGGGAQPKSYFNNNNTNSPIVSFVITVIDFAITIMGSIAVVLFIVAGFMFMVAGGQSQKLDEAKDIIKYAAIGLIVALLSYVITIFVQSIFSNG